MPDLPQVPAISAVSGALASALSVHGGPDAQGVPLHDFSTNSNACGPCPHALRAVQQADPTRYPDPTYTALRTRLAAFHGVDASRIALAASASEFIFRITAWAARQGVRHAVLPRHAYGDYRQAAQAWGMAVQVQPADGAASVASAALSVPPVPLAAGTWHYPLAGIAPTAIAPRLWWACDPASPLGHAPAHLSAWAAQCEPAPIPAPSAVICVLDCAYAPLRLSGEPALHALQRDRVWQLFSPNKALGLTGVRGAYAIAPLGADAAVQALQALCPSWPLGAHGLAMLHAWCDSDSQHWLASARDTLRAWKAEQIALCQDLGWTVLPSVANFFGVRDVLAPGASADAWPALLAHLRAHGIKVRDCASFGLEGHWRLGVLPPAAQAALRSAWRRG